MKRGATKEEIIRITQALIARNGIRAVRVDEIAQTLGISKRTLYEMFADKDDLINACLDAMSSKQRERIATYRKQRSGSALQRTFKLDAAAQHRYPDAAGRVARHGVRTCQQQPFVMSPHDQPEQREGRSGDSGKQQ